MVGGDSHGFHDQLENNRGFALVVCTLRNTGRGGFGQRLSLKELSQFLKQNGVKFTRVPLHNSASNRAAERSVQTAKTALTKQVLDGKANSLSLEHKLANFLILNRSTPHIVIGQSPAEQCLGRQIRNCFTLLKPNFSRAVDEQQLNQQERYELNEVVLVRNCIAAWRGKVDLWKDHSGDRSAHLPSWL